MRSFGPRPRRSPSSLRESAAGSERLAATITTIEVVPILDIVLAELPAEIDLPSLHQSREVDQAPIDVPQHDSRLRHGVEQTSDLEKGHSDLPSLLAAAVGWGRLGEHLVGLAVGELILGPLQLRQQRAQLRQKSIRLLLGEVALMDELGALVGHAPAAAVRDARRSRSRSASALPIVRS